MSDRERVLQSQVWAGAPPSPRGTDFSFLSSWGTCPPSHAGPDVLSAGGCLTLETPPPPTCPAFLSTGPLLESTAPGPGPRLSLPSRWRLWGPRLPRRPSSPPPPPPQGPVQDPVVNKDGGQRRPCSSPRDLDTCLLMWRKELCGCVALKTLRWGDDLGVFGPP